MSASPEGPRAPRPRLLLEGKLLLLLGAVALLVGLASVLAQRHVLRVELAELRSAETRASAPSVATLERLAARSTTVTALTAASACFVLLLCSRLLVRRITRPLRGLTAAADQVAMGNLDPAVRAGRVVNCWEIKGCAQTGCAAYQNYDQRCWYIDNTPCEGSASRFPEKLRDCERCAVYRVHRGDELQQLNDALRHMTGALQQSKEELLRSGDFQRRLIRNSYNGVLATDPRGEITIFNRAAEGMLEIDRSEVIGKLDWREFIDPALDRELDQPLSYGPVRRVRGFRLTESVLRKPNGETVSVLLSGINLFDRGRHLGRVFFFQDLREVKHLREELIRSERLAATGQAAAGISHSVKNILDGFRGGAYVFEQGKRHGNQEKMDTGWEMVQRNVEIISRLVVDLLDFAKERELQLVEVDARELVRGTLEDLPLKEACRVGVTVVLEPDSEQVVLDPVAFEPCLLHLIRNAVEAIPLDRDGHIRIGYQRRDGEAVFTVSDDGAGMSEETMEKLKGGMYSTKGSKGTGLGLLMIQKVVDEHEGTLSIESKEEVGTTFRISLPQPREAVVSG